MGTDFTLYAIADPSCSRGRVLDEMVSSAIEGGATVVQLRDKTASAKRFLGEAKALSSLARTLEVPFIVNDRVDVALASNADGVHLGQEDLPCSEARRLLGSGKLIGVSAHSLQEAREAEQQGADYISLGKIYPSVTKTEGTTIGLSALREVVAAVHLPVVAIGGIGLANLKEVFEAGAAGVALISGLFDAEDVKARAMELCKEIARCPRGEILPLGRRQKRTTR